MRSAVRPTLACNGSGPLATIFRGDRAGVGIGDTLRGSQRPVRRLNPAWGLVGSKDEQDRQRDHRPGSQYANPMQHRNVMTRLCVQSATVPDGIDVALWPI